MNPTPSRRAAPGQPTMHCQAELEADLCYPGLLPDEVLLRWFDARYSTSKHLLTLYSIARGLRARRLLEIGFGRSSFVLARAAHENGGHLTTCDIHDFGHLLSEPERAVTTLLQGRVEELWDRVPGGVEFAFLDYFSAEPIAAEYCIEQIELCLSRLKCNGVIAVHDAFVDRYSLQDALVVLQHRLDNQVEVAVLPYNYGLGLIRRISPSPFGTLEEQWLKKPEPAATSPLPAGDETLRAAVLGATEQLRRGLVAEARETLEQARLRFPEEPQLVDLLRQLDAALTC